ncbi:MAG: AmmeMemoRadiSam system protein B [Ignavibacteria bacterium]|nr:AmmeMemoRadiSam system protein B [Ignavibacteria bacterium]
MITDEIRKPVVAGMFYEYEPSKLKKTLNQFFDSARPEQVEGKIIGLVSPHAGYFYSGLTAAYAYKLLQGKEYETVVVISPSHQEYFDGISIYNGIGYMTPFGVIDVDEELRSKIISHKGPLMLSKSGHRNEHALEVQLPFLQSVLKEFKLLPIVIGNQKHEYCFELAQVLAEELSGKNVLIVASSDLSHYLPHDVCNQIDSRIHSLIESFNEEELMNRLEDETVQACGGGPIVSVMHASKLLGANKSKVVYRTDSSEASGDKRQVVGYLSAVFYKEKLN